MPTLERTSEAISPTAHYTGEVWRRAGLSDPALGTREGRLLHAALRPAMALSTALGGDSLEPFLLARHRLIDLLLEAEIAAGRIGQVVEIAAGMSPRGLRLARRHPQLTYVEADLPPMARRKRAALLEAGATHRVADIDALAEHGPLSLAALVEGLDQSRGLAVVSEGLLNYFPRAQTDAIWRQIAAAIGAFPCGSYISDLHLHSSNSGGAQRAFGALLGIFVRGRVHFPYRDAADALGALEAAGFERARLHPGSEAGSGPGVERVDVPEAHRG